MGDRQLALLLLLSAASTVRDGEDGRGGGLVSRVAARATGAVADIVDPDAVLNRVDVNAVLERVDVNAVLERVDIDTLLDRVDVNALLDRVDIDQLMARVDIDTLLDRVDIDRMMARVDVEDLVDRAGIGDIVRESTGALAGSAIDVIRRQIVALDSIVGRAIYQLTRRDPSQRPPAPAALQGGAGVDETGRGQITGHYAGAVSRLLAFAADAVIGWVGFLLMALAVGFLVNLFTSIEDRASELTALGLVIFAMWAFLYYWASLTVAGKTIGMAVVGLRVLTRDGEVLPGRRAAVRTFVEPFSFLFFGLGFIGILISPERRALHDAAAGSVVVYDWGDRPAEMPAPITRWISSHHDEE
jgi:uncharacterized RDD family membrane protein YckC